MPNSQQNQALHSAADSFSLLEHPDSEADKDPYSSACMRRYAVHTLAWVNGRRVKLNLAPLRVLRKGVRYHLRDNPVARSIGHCNIGIASRMHDEETHIYVLPSPVIHYLSLFHDGYYPDHETSP